MKNIFTVLILLVLLPFLSMKGQTAVSSDTTITLKEFEITDLTGKKVAQPATSVTEEMISRVPARDIGDFMRSQPNISGIRKGGTGIDPVIRGFKYSQLNVQLNEGHKIEAACPNRMDPPTAHVDISDIQQIEIFKGPYALRFGPNFGGLVHLHTWPEKVPDHFQANVTAITGFESAWTGLKESLALMIGNRYFQVKLAGNYKKYGDYQDGNGNTVPSSFERYNYGAMVRITPSEKHTIILSEDRATGKNLDFPALPMDERLDFTTLYSADYVYKNPGKIFQAAHAKIYLSDVNHEMDNKQRPVSDTVVAVSEISAINFGYRAEGGFSIAGGTFHAGTDMEDISKDGNRVKTFIMQPTMPVKTEKLWDNAHISNYGVFAEFVRPFGRFIPVFAIRLDFNQAGSDTMTYENMQGATIYEQDKVSSSFTNFSLSVGSDWALNDRLTMNLSLGKGVRSPDMTERFIILLPIGYDNYDYLGNPALKPEINYQADLSVKWQVPKTGLFNFGIFFSFVNNYIAGVQVPESVVKPQTKGVYGVKQFTNLDNAWLTGFELSYSSPSDKVWVVEAQAGLTYGINPEAVHYIIEEGEVTGSEIIKNDALPEIPPFEASAGFSWKFFEGRLIPKAIIRAVTAQNHISIAYDERETPGFILAGLSLYYKFNKVLDVSAGIDNLFDEAYYEHLNRNMVGTRANFYEPGRNIYINLKFSL